MPKRSDIRRIPKARGTCRVCRHPERHRIDSLLAGGASLDSIIRKFGVSKDSAHRHFKNHIHADDLDILKGSPAALANLAEKAAAESMSVLDYLQILRGRLMASLSTASQAGDNPGVCRTSTTLLSVLQEIGKLTGEIERAAGIIINAGNTNNHVSMTMNDPLIGRMQQMLLHKLAPFPQARAAVIEGLAELEVDRHPAISP